MKLYFVFIIRAGLMILLYIYFKMLEWIENNLESIQVLKISIRTNHELSPSLLTPLYSYTPHPYSTHKFFQPRKIFLPCLRVEFTASVLHQSFLSYQLTAYLQWLFQGTTALSSVLRATALMKCVPFRLTLASLGPYMNHLCPHRLQALHFRVFIPSNK